MRTSTAFLRPALRPALLAAMLLVAACESAPKGPDLPRRQSGATAGDQAADGVDPLLQPRRELEVVSHCGGTHHRTLAHRSRWYQTFSTELLVLDPRAGSIIARTDLAEIGKTGPAVDLAILGDRALVVLDRDEVVELDVSDPDHPRRIASADAVSLGLHPRRVSAAGGELYVAGEGGVVRWSDRKRLLAEVAGTPSDLVPKIPVAGDPSRENSAAGTPAARERGARKPDARKSDDRKLDSRRPTGQDSAPQAPTTPDAAAAREAAPALSVGAVATADVGPVACVGRRVHALGDGAYVGAASELLELPASAGAPLAFALQGKTGARVGLMGGDVRERSTDVVPGTVRRLRCFDGRLWVVTDTEIVSFAISGGELSDRRRISVRGARDVDMLGPNVLAVAGSFGRALYRPAAEGDRPGDTFYVAHREASRLTAAITDNRRILAGSEEGNWLYLIGSAAELSDRSLAVWQQPIAKAQGTWGSAAISEDGQWVVGEIDGLEQRYAPEGRPQIWCLASIDGELWVGHDYGIDVLGKGGDGRVKRVSTLRLDGPVRYLFPKWDGGGVFVAEFGGFGVARLVERPPALAPPGSPSAPGTASKPADDGAAKGSRGDLP